jgi:hypothetical protein
VRSAATLVSAIAIATAAACALAAGDSRSERASDLLAAVDSTDGISRSEADQIARAYFLINVGCGAYVGIKGGGGAWIVEGLFGYAGEPMKDFRIDKATGAASYPSGASYASLAELKSVAEARDAKSRAVPSKRNR